MTARPDARFYAFADAAGITGRALRDKLARNAEAAERARAEAAARRVPAWLRRPVQG